MSGYYGFGNSGDEAVLAGIIASLKEECPAVEVVVLSSDPSGTEALHGVRAVNRMSPTEVLGALRSADLLISGGGSLLQDVSSTRSLLYYLAVIWLAKRLDKKVMVYAQGVGPLCSGINRRMVRSVLNRVDEITVRDDASKAYLEELEIVGVRVHVTADPSFCVEAGGQDEADQVLKAAGVPEGIPLIGVSLRPWREQVNWLPEVATGLGTAAARAGAALVFLPMQPDQDTSISVQVASHISSPSFVVTSKLSPAQMLAVTGRMSLLVGMRLHALMFAASMGVPFLGIAYDPKVTAFVSIADQGEPLTLDDLSGPETAARLYDAWENREELAGRIRQSGEGLRAAARENARLACGLIKEH